MTKIIREQFKNKHVETRYCKLLENMQEGYQIIDRNWRYLYVNNAAAVHAGKQKQELLGRTLMDVYPGIENSEFFSILKSCMLKRIVHKTENEFTYPDGPNVWLSLNIHPVPDGLSVLSIDITARKIAEIEIQKLNDVLGKRVAGRTAQLLIQPAKNSHLPVIKNSLDSGRRIAW